MPIMANTRTLKSRNQREGHYLGHSKGMAMRFIDSKNILSDDAPRGNWSGLNKDQIKRSRKGLLILLSTFSSGTHKDKP